MAKRKRTKSKKRTEMIVTRKSDGRIQKEKMLLECIDLEANNKIKAKDYAQFVRNLSDDEFEAFFDKVKNAYYKNRSLADRGLDKENKVADAATFFGEYDNYAIWKKINDSRMTDIFKFPDTNIDEMVQITMKWNPELKWRIEGYSGHGWPSELPADILISGTVPLLDFSVLDNERIKETMLFRVSIFENYHELIHDVNVALEPVLVGAIMIPFFGGVVWANIMVDVMENKMYPSLTYGTHDLTPKAKTDLRAFPASYLNQSFIHMMCLWYGIETALLHPKVKTIVMSTPSLENTTESTGDVEKKETKNTSQKKRVYKYVKRHVIKPDDITNAIQSPYQPKGIHRKVKLWYVMGHWRTYKSGKKVFISPYWKGELRDIKIAAEARERELVVSDEAAKGVK